MFRKMINHGIAIIGIAILIFLAVGSASAPSYAGPDAEVTYTEYNIRNKQGSFRGYKEDSPSNYRAGDGFKIITFLQIINNELQIDASDGDYIKFAIETVNNLYPQFEVRFKNTRPEPSVVFISIHPKDPSNPKKDLYFRLDRIDGLISLEEAEKIVAEKKEAEAKKVAEESERKAQEETQRQAWEEAKKNFIIIPEHWNPVHYTKTDLFKAVAASKDLKIYSSKLDAIWGGSFLWCVSDLKFVRQNGTDITFSSDDNSITQIMSIDQRSGLQAGQKVRVYYDITRSPLIRWDVIAIEKR